MHIPDGFLDAKTAGATLGLAVVGVGWAVKHVRQSIPEHKVPLLGLTAAFVFAAQMLNFPVIGGTSGHLVGGILSTVLLGPSAGILVLASVLMVQCLVFADGGLLSLGANIFNMGLVGAVAGYGIYWLVRRRVRGLQGQLVAAAFASWCSVVLASICCAAELAFSGTAAWGAAFPAMAGIHMLIGVGESVITVLVLAAIARTRPDLLENNPQTEKIQYSGIIVYGLLIAVGMALFISPFASHWPDGLETVAHDIGFLGKPIKEPMLPAPLHEYSIPGISSPAMATALAGVVGTVVMFIFAIVLARVVVARQTMRCPAE